MILVALLFCCGNALEAQTITGSVNGTVTDPTGAVIPNAKVTATNVDTGIETPSTTNSDGIYNIAFLQIGNNCRSINSCSNLSSVGFFSDRSTFSVL